MNCPYSDHFLMLVERFGDSRCYDSRSPQSATICKLSLSIDMNYLRGVIKYTGLYGRVSNARQRSIDLYIRYHLGYIARI